MLIGLEFWPLLLFVFINTPIDCWVISNHHVWLLKSGKLAICKPDMNQWNVDGCLGHLGLPQKWGATRTQTDRPISSNSIQVTYCVEGNRTLKSFPMRWHMMVHYLHPCTHIIFGWCWTSQPLKNMLVSLDPHVKHHILRTEHETCLKQWNNTKLRDVLLGVSENVILQVITLMRTYGDFLKWR